MPLAVEDFAVEHRDVAALGADCGERADGSHASVAAWRVGDVDRGVDEAAPSVLSAGRAREVIDPAPLQEATEVVCLPRFDWSMRLGCLGHAGMLDRP